MISNVTIDDVLAKMSTLDSRRLAGTDYELFTILPEMNIQLEHIYDNDYKLLTDIYKDTLPKSSSKKHTFNYYDWVKFLEDLTDLKLDRLPRITDKYNICVLKRKRTDTTIYHK